MGFQRNKIMDSLDARDVVKSLGLEIKYETAARFKIRCPHGNADPNPSCCVYTKDKSFYCFSCGERGSMIDLVMLVKGTNYHDTLEWLANLAGGSDRYQEGREVKRKAKTLPFLTSTEQKLLGLKSFPVYVINKVYHGHKVGSGNTEIELGEDLYGEKSLIQGNPLRELYDTDAEEYKRLVKRKAYMKAQKVQGQLARMEALLKIEHHKLLEALIAQDNEILAKIKEIYIMAGGSVMDFPQKNEYLIKISDIKGIPF